MEVSHKISVFFFCWLSPLLSLCLSRIQWQVSQLTSLTGRLTTWDVHLWAQIWTPMWKLCNFSLLQTAAVSISISAVCSLIHGPQLCQCSHNLSEDVYAGKQTALIFMTRTADTHTHTLHFNLVHNCRWSLSLFVSPPLSACPLSYIFSFPEIYTRSLSLTQILRADTQGIDPGSRLAACYRCFSSASVPHAGTWCVCTQCVCVSSAELGLPEGRDGEGAEWLSTVIHL